MDLTPMIIMKQAQRSDQGALQELLEPLPQWARDGVHRLLKDGTGTVQGPYEGGGFFLFVSGGRVVLYTVTSITPEQVARIAVARDMLIDGSRTGRFAYVADDLELFRLIVMRALGVTPATMRNLN